jgi:uncharacterized protein YbjT (DUF2867 family)
MRVVVFGASGSCGGHFVRLAVARGHVVSAVVRAQTPFDAPSGVQIARGDVLDPAFVAAVMSGAGADAVVSAVGMRYKHPWAKRMSPDDFTSRAITNIAAAMTAAGVRRIAVISAAGVGDSRPALNWMMRAMLAIKAYADLERAEAVLRASGLDWQAVRPTTLTHKAATGRVRVTDRYRVSDSIPREDVAAFILREVETAAPAQRTPMITAG